MGVDVESYVPRMRLPPYQHQLVGIKLALEHEWWLNASEMGSGKSRIMIDAALIMYDQDIIDQVIIVAPAGVVMGVWYDIDLGELVKHLWFDVRVSVERFHAKPMSWLANWSLPALRPPLRITVSNYEYLRNEDHLKRLMKQAKPGRKTLLVLDEASAVQENTSAQTKAMRTLRKQCGRVMLMDGMPVAQSPMSMFSKALIMSPDVLGCTSKTLFRARYATMGGYEGRSIIAWPGLERLQEQLKPYVWRVLKRDCLDLPERLPPVSMLVPLTPTTWSRYKQQRDDLVLQLSNTQTVTAPQAATLMMRLAQITSGFIGGVRTDPVHDDGMDWFEGLDLPPVPALKPDADAVVELSREKLDALFELIDRWQAEEPDVKIIVWCTFRFELLRMMDEARKRYPRTLVEGIYGGQKSEERKRALTVLDPRAEIRESAIVGGILSAGALGLNLTAAHIMVNMSHDCSITKYSQGASRIDRPGQTRPTSYVNLVATGPSGQKTVDHRILKIRDSSEALGTQTTSAWVHSIMQE